ncbi:MAG: Bax inhibitor-1/YccA family protein [Rhodanobacteraceae bacterium]|nr:MAG: Bax inhibitor-1/YccA family protein [Rhodanobacteraceae bacterium]
MRSSNPILRGSAFRNLPAVTTGEPMTINGTIARTGILIGLALITGWWTWNRFMAAAAAVSGLPAGVVAGGSLPAGAAAAAGMAAGVAAISPFLWGGIIVGFVLALAGTFKPNWSPVAAPLYAIAEGTALGGISAMFNVQYHGIVLQAILATVGVLVVMLALYRTGVIKVTNKFRMGVMAATGGILLLYLASWVLGMFTHVDMAFVYGGGGTFGVIFSLFVVCIAALNLVLDFDLIDRASQAKLPKYMEWYGALALMVTLVWLYIQMLQLLASSRR